MKPEFYLEIVNPEAKKNKYLLSIDIREVRGRDQFFYSVFWPCDKLVAGKKEAKAWCKKERVEALKINVHKISEIIHRNSKGKSRHGKQTRL